MILRSEILWSNDMSLAVGLKTELDKEDFVEKAIQTHLELTGDILIESEFRVTEDKVMLKLELK